MSKEEANTTGNLNRKKWGIIGVILAVLIALIVGISIYNTPANRLSRQLNLGNRYLEEENYEQAIVEFDKAIAIDPMCVDAYLGKAQAYIGLDDLTSAAETLQAGYELTNDERLKSKLDEIEAEMLRQKQAEEEAQRAAEGADGLADAETLRQENTGEKETNPDKMNDEDDEDIPDSVEEQGENPENGAWVDDLYQKMTAGDAEGVYAIIEGADFIDKCSEYEHGEISEGCTEYGLSTSDGKKIGVIYLVNWDEYIVVHCIHDEADADVLMYCPRYIAIGDYYYYIDNGSKSWFGGNVWHYADGSIEELQFSDGGVMSIMDGMPE